MIAVYESEWKILRHPQTGNNHLGIVIGHISGNGDSSGN